MLDFNSRTFSSLVLFSSVGFASSIAAINVNNLKTTYDAQTPVAIIGDTEILKGAPYRMIAAGLGDYANPTSILKAAAMLLRHICYTAEAEKLEAALAACPVTVTGDKDGATCAEFADALMQIL